MYTFQEIDDGKNDIIMTMPLDRDTKLLVFHDAYQKLGITPEAAKNLMSAFGILICAHLSSKEAKKNV